MGDLEVSEDDGSSDPLESDEGADENAVGFLGLLNMEVGQALAVVESDDDDDVVPPAAELPEDAGEEVPEELVEVRRLPRVSAPPVQRGAKGGSRTDVNWGRKRRVVAHWRHLGTLNLTDRELMSQLRVFAAKVGIKTVHNQGQVLRWVSACSEAHIVGTRKRAARPGAGRVHKLPPVD